MQEWRSPPFIATTERHPMNYANYAFRGIAIVREVVATTALKAS